MLIMTNLMKFLHVVVLEIVNHICGTSAETSKFLIYFMPSEKTSVVALYFLFLLKLREGARF